MKKSILILLFFIALGVKAQGNLVFNQVLTITPGISYNVPSGKVLKIESVNITSNSVCVPKSSTVSFICNTAYGYSYPSEYGIYDPITYMIIGNLSFMTAGFNGSPGSYCQSPYATNSSCWNATISSTSFNCPIWLEAGKTVKLDAGVASILISAIEFNVVQ
jgi:hypothetical protein